MRQTARWTGWAIMSLLGAAACSEKTEIAREPAQAGDQRGDASAGPTTPGGGRTDSIGSGGNHGATTGEAGEGSDAGTAPANSNGNASSGNAGASGSGSAGNPATPADAGVGVGGAGGVGGSAGIGGVGGSAGTAAGGSDGGVGPFARCLVSGCSNTICAEQIAGPMVSSCEFQAEYACYATATCERQGDGQCGWTQTQDLIDCINNARGM